MLVITQKLENIIYGYTPGEFLPIYEDGKVANTKAFVWYKTKKAARYVIMGLITIIRNTNANISSQPNKTAH